MSARLECGCLPTAIGSMPHTNPDEACSVVMKYLSDMPAWPQLPRRSPEENMIIQFSEGFPGIIIKGDKIHIEPSVNFETDLEQIYIDCEQDDAQKYDISDGYAAGLHAFLSKATGSKIAKGQVTGPVTWGLSVTSQDGLGILYDDTLAETVAKFLRLKASWQENILREITPNTIIFVDEPYLVSLGSVFTPIPEEKVPVLLEEVLGGIKGLKGLHCCGNSNWAALLDIRIDILSFDAYNYVSSLSTYSDKVKSFLERGGNIAWGIVPNRDGVGFKQIIAQGLITPSCGLASLSLEAANQALELTAKLSHDLRSRYVA